LRDYSVDGQLGLEKTSEEYIEKIVAGFREIRRILRPDGTVWLNLGDSYVSGKGRYSSNAQTISGHSRHEPGQGQRPDQKNHAYLKDKDLAGIPWRVALALQADGWWLRSDIIWAKPNPMPESVTDRPTKSHEYIFLLTKSAKYHYDQEAVREPLKEESKRRAMRGNSKNNKYAKDQHLPKGVHANTMSQPRDYRGYGNMDEIIKNGETPLNPSGRNLRSVWTIPTQPCSFAHFATFPEEIPNKCILAGTSPKACGICGAPYKRTVEKRIADKTSPRPFSKSGNEKNRNDVGRIYKETVTKTIGFRPTCKHNDDTGKCIVLDPFCGTNTVGYRAQEMGHNWVGIELNPKYANYGETKVNQKVLI